MNIKTFFRAKRIDNGEYVEGNFFTTPLTEENANIKPEDGLFFLSDGVTRCCIEREGVAYVVDPNTLGECINLKKINVNITTFDFKEIKEKLKTTDPMIVNYIKALSDRFKDQKGITRKAITKVNEQASLIAEWEETLKDLYKRAVFQLGEEANLDEVFILAVEEITKEALSKKK